MKMKSLEVYWIDKEGKQKWGKVEKEDGGFLSYEYMSDAADGESYVEGRIYLEPNINGYLLTKNIIDYDGVFELPYGIVWILKKMGYETKDLEL